MTGMTQKFALVTGTSRGLGEAQAQYLLEQGFTVLGVSRSGSTLSHDSYIDIEADLREESAIETMYETIRQVTEELHLVVLNAGILTLDTVFETSTLDFRNNLDTNVLAPFHILKHLADFIVENQTHIVTISSMAGKKAFPNMAAYSASKFALEGLIQTCREEWKDLGVRFSTLYPGAIDTGLWHDVELGDDQHHMLTIDDFLFVFDTLLQSPPNLQFHSLVFGHREGVNP